MHSIISRYPLATLLLLAVLVGIGAALGAALFHEIIHFSTWVFYRHGESTVFLTRTEDIPTWQRILIPTLGGLLVGLVYKYARVSEAEGEGVPEVMEALAHHRGTIRPVVAPVKILTAAITLGSGGSAGREGPIIQIGSAIGSSIAQFFKLGAKDRSILLAAGAAAAIGGTFGAPIAGVLFTLEILRHSLRVFNILLISIAAWIGFWGVRLLTGREGLRFPIMTEFEFQFSFLLWLGAICIAAGLVGFLCKHSLTISRKLFISLPAPHFLKPAIGGFFIGLLGLFFPYIHEPAAYPFMINIFSFSTLPVTLLITLLFLKLFATALTLGSGGSGGVFAPTLFIGAIVGSLVGSAVLAIHGTSAGAPLFLVAGMAASFAAIAHAPLTAAIICFEITDSSLTMLPLLILTCFGASFLSKALSPQSVYHIET